MACERWWFSTCCSVNLFVVLLVTTTIGFSLVIQTGAAATPDIDDSYYRYDNSLLSGEPLHFLLHDEFLVRNRRSPIEPLNPNVSSTTPSTSTTSQASSHFEKVAYSTDNNTKNSTSLPTSSTTSQVKSEVIVSQPLNPVSGGVEVEHPKVWANATMRPIIAVHSQNVTESNEKEITDEDFPKDAIDIDKFGDVTNSTLTQNNITKTQEDTHQYYNSTMFVDETEGKKYWVDLTNHPNVKVNELLSDSHRRAATVKLSFDFPFYGHMVRNVTIATGGFLYTGEYVHSWLAATQYIAPLMANFDTRLSNNSYVKYADNGTAFTVEWQKVVLQEKPNVGEFTFQVTLHKNGDIVFVYAVVPLEVKEIQDNLHPVKVGLSDAYIIDRTVFFVRRKTIYEYHRVNFMSQDIKNWTVIYLRALPTCLGLDNCNSCLNKTTDFPCKWCPSLNRCSTGTDRHKQEWLVKGCETSSILNQESCPAVSPTATTYNERNVHVNTETTGTNVHEHTENVHEHTETVHERVPANTEAVHTDEASSASVQPSLHEARALGSLEHAPDKMKMGVSGILGILLVISLAVGLVAWGGYAYRNPHSASGQVLIRYRPSQWSWRRGEARYTAATIHM